MKILAFCDNIPFKQHNQPGVTAAHIVSHEILMGLHRLGFTVMLQRLTPPTKSEATPAERDEITYLEKEGIAVLPPLAIPEALTHKPRFGLQWIAASLLESTLAGKVEDSYNAVRLRHQVQRRVEETQPDAILTVWSPDAIAATDKAWRIPRIAYHGDIDFQPAWARSRDKWLFYSPSKVPHAWITDLLERLQYAKHQRMHVRLMQGVDVIANVTASNASFYSRKGHRKSVYVGNTWPDPRHYVPQHRKPVNHLQRPVKIIGHVGYLNRTGSTYGLKFLLVDVMPRLENALKGLDYEVHIIGGGQMVPALQPYLNHPRIRLRGYVEDLDAELYSGDMLLLLNNHGRYVAGYTRHIIAWAMGLCLIVHANSQRAIPEIRHKENALMGSTANEVASAIALAATEHALNLKVRAGGRATYEKHYTPRVVAQKLANEITGAIAVGTW